MSYDETLPTDKDKARALLGDTNEDAELLTDAHIEAALDLYGYSGGVAFLASELVTRFAQKPTDVGLPSGLRVAWRERIAAWKALASQMQNGGVTGAFAFAIGMTRTDGYSEAADLEAA